MNDGIRREWAEHKDTDCQKEDKTQPNSTRNLLHTQPCWSVKGKMRGCQLSWRRRHPQLSSSHNHIKITTKIQNNHHSELQELKLNASLTTMELEKPHPPRLVGGAQMAYGLVPHPRVVGKHSGGISRERGVRAPHQAPSPGFQCQEDKSPQLLAAQTSGD